MYTLLHTQTNQSSPLQECWLNVTYAMYLIYIYSVYKYITYWTLVNCGIPFHTTYTHNRWRAIMLILSIQLSWPVDLYYTTGPALLNAPLITFKLVRMYRGTATNRIHIIFAFIKWIARKKHRTDISASMPLYGSMWWRKIIELCVFSMLEHWVALMNRGDSTSKIIQCLQPEGR